MELDYLADLELECSSDDEPTTGTKDIGRPKKQLSLKCKENQLFRRRIKEVRDKFMFFCEDEHVNTGITLAKLGSMILHDSTNKKHYDLKTAELFKKIATEQDLCKGAELDADDGVYLMQELEIGRDKMINFKQYMETKKVHVVCTAKIAKRRKLILPVPEDCFKKGKTELRYKDK